MGSNEPPNYHPQPIDKKTPGKKTPKYIYITMVSSIWGHSYPKKHIICSCLIHFMASTTPYSPFLFNLAKENKATNSEWKDHNVSQWKITEEIKHSIQKDGSSCGLFVLYFLECWTGTRLSPICKQEDMVHFRQKLAVLLVNSKLNKAKRGAAVNDPTEADQPHGPGNGETKASQDDPEDCVLIDNLP
ncbi:hypothetical protein ACP70R_026298 [Stipagrostis hirtigluma subsp. patula]